MFQERNGVLAAESAQEEPHFEYNILSSSLFGHRRGRLRRTSIISGEQDNSASNIRIVFKLLDQGATFIRLLVENYRL